MRTDEFDFDLPRELIAQYPLERRADSRLLHLNARTGALEDARISDLPRFLRPGDLLVLNDTKVIKARLFGRKETGGKIEVLVERVLSPHEVIAQVRASHAVKPGTRLELAPQIVATVTRREGDFFRIRIEAREAIHELLERYGQVPLPPYIERPAETLDESRYQTVYAREPGAVAAPTAGLHFDPELLNRLGANGVDIAYVTLHVGAGTFQPVREEDVAEHRMHSERYRVPEKTVAKVAEVKQRGGKVVAVGTTSLRALEAAAREGDLTAGGGETDLFIVPGFRFRVAERLLTNFHLPRSSLMMLVCAFAGIENIRRAYAHAIEQRYRFFSYGDAMLIERAR